MTLLSHAAWGRMFSFWIACNQGERRGRGRERVGRLMPSLSDAACPGKGRLISVLLLGASDGSSLKRKEFSAGSKNGAHLHALHLNRRLSLNQK